MSQVYRFDMYEVDADRRELRRAGDVLDVQPKVLDLIVRLVRSRERVVTRQELLDELWGDAAVSEGVLTTAIHAARSVLGDTASRGWAIKTVARRGYRFVAAVSEDGGTGPAAQTAAGQGGEDAWAADAFVGRDRPLARLDAAFAAAGAGRGRVVIVTGESGIGKTRLLDELMTRPTVRSGRVLPAWCHGSEGTPPYAPWAQILRQAIAGLDPAEALMDLGAGAADLVALVPAIHELRPDLPEPPRLQSGTSRFRLFESIATYLGNLSKRSPMLLLLDDIQSADDGSLRLLGYLAREVRHQRVLVVASLRPNEPDGGSVLEETLAELAHQFPGERMAIEGMTREETGRLIEQLTGEVPAPEVVDTILTRSEGNPFFIKEIVSLMESGGADVGCAAIQDWASAVPPGVRDVILGRVHRRSTACQRVLSAASVLGRQLPLDVLARIVEIEPAALSAAIAEACTAGFLAEQVQAPDHYRFTHGLLHETVYNALAAEERKRFHSLAGDALEAVSPGVSEASAAGLAHHFLRAGRNGATAKAIDYAERAAEEAAALHGDEEAARHYGIALDALERAAAPDDARRCELLISLGAARLGVRNTDPRGRDSLVQAVEIAQSIGDPMQLARAVLEAAAGAMLSGPGDAELIELLEKALGALEELHDEAGDILRARTMAYLAFQMLGSPSWERGLSLSEQAVALARKSGQPAVICETLNLRCMLRSGPDHAHARLREADDLRECAAEAGMTELGLFGHRWRLLTMLELGEMEAADRELADYNEAADRGRIWSARWYDLTVRGARALSEGRLESADRMIVEAFANRRDDPTPLIINAFATQLFWLRREQGRLAEIAHLRLTERADRYLPFHALRMFMNAEGSAPELAASELRKLVGEGLAHLPRDFTFLYGVSVLAEVCASARDQDCARALYDVLAPYADQFAVLFLGTVQLGSISRFLGKLAAVLGEWDAADAHFADALVANDGIHAYLWAAHTRLDWATMLEARGGENAERAGEILRPCIATAEERGLTELRRRALDLTDRLPH